MITIYTKPACVQCEATKRKFDRLGITYVEVDLTEDAAAMARVTSWDYRQAPVVEVGPDHHWCGYQPALIEGLLGE